MKKISSILTVVSLTILFWAKNGHADGGYADDEDACFDYYDENPTKDVYGEPDIDSSSVKTINGSPLVITRIVSPKQKICNFGTYIFAQPTGESNVTLTGPMTCGRTLQYWKTEYAWSSNIRKSVYETVDGRGFPLESIVLWYNEEYGTPEAACDYSDGIVATDVQGAVAGYQPNDNFDYFLEKCQQIQCYNTCVEVDNATALNYWWYPRVDNQSTYYVYTSRYYDEMFRKNCTTTVILFSFSTILSTISIDQHKKCFGTVQNSSGQNYDTREDTLYDKRNMTFYEGKGITLVGYPET